MEQGLFTKKDLEKEYQKWCLTFDGFFKAFNVCGWRTDQDGNTTCHGMRRGVFKNSPTGCCGDCKLFNNGCPTQNLSCKIFLCQEAADNLPERAKEDYKKLLFGFNQEFKGWNHTETYKVEKEDCLKSIRRHLENKEVE